MKGFLIALLTVLSFGFMASGQTSLLATLNHEGTISTFYGATALQAAHEAAVNGDVITLSSGTFASVNITKAVTIRGAGMLLDSENGIEPTVLASDFDIDVPVDESGNNHHLILEGLYSNQDIRVNKLTNAQILKCRFSEFSYKANGEIMKDLSFIHCRIAKRITFLPNSSASFIGCVINEFYEYTGLNGYFSFINCYIGNGRVSNSEYRNCLVAYSNNGAITSTYYNNLHICTGLYSLTNTNSSNVRIDRSDERVKDLIGDYSDDKTYELNDALRQLIKGTDGTEVGLYGGNLPYEVTPTNPQITKFNVAAKTTADGKLSVDIEVKSAE